MARIDQVMRETQLMTALANPRGLNIAEFARDNGYVERTIRRDLEVLEQIHPIYQEHPGVYRLNTTPRAPTVAALAPDELLAVDAARRGVNEWRRTHLGRALDRAWAKLSAVDAAAPEPRNRRGDSLASLSFGDHLGIEYDSYHRIIDTLEAARRDQVAVQCSYRRVKGGEVSQRIIEPGQLHAEPALDSLYCIAWCRLRQDVRVFAVHRFLSATCTDIPTVPRTDSRSQTAFKHAFHVWREANATDVHLRFTGDATTFVDERVIHRSQRKVRNPDGTLDLFVTVGGIQEILRWLLAYGSAVRVIAPDALAAAHQHELRQAIAAYDQLINLAAATPPLATPPTTAISGPIFGHPTSEASSNCPHPQPRRSPTPHK